MTESTATVPPIAVSEGVTKALAARDYARVARIAYNDPGQFTDRGIDHDDEYGKEYEPLYRWQRRAESAADALIAGHIAAREAAARCRGEVAAWTLMVDMLARFGEVAAVGGQGAPRAAQDAECYAIVQRWARHELDKAGAALVTAVEAIPS